MKTFKARHLVASFMLGSLFFSGVGYAASSLAMIEVNFLPLKYYFDGVEKKAPDDQKGFTYKGTTYVPLRFVAESLSKKVGYDGKTTSIYVGKQKEGTVTYMEDMKTHTSDTGYFFDGPLTTFETNTGAKFIHGYATYNGIYGEGFIKNEYILDGQFSKFEAYLAPSLDWSKKPKSDNVGDLKLYADDKLIYSSGAIASDIQEPIKVDADLKGALKLRVEFTVKPFYNTSYNSAYVGLLDAKFIN
ncbi:stalk domain-containing protein [Paenibacillus protaetiae]|uniref:Copper amine oxidase-like N-terminal domain-containing protein n=1 Tax=Paenibacillus protaetiae TaxID=2509456 RepID=A0A4V0YF38_9BACL|nr:stalk domain-containing protein [Paenibacillus protaetiae]QAY66361.1 hypothetical protein ET464_08020 [Paenibacillus protaetiae]